MKKRRFQIYYTRVVGVLDSSAEGPEIQIAAATLSDNRLRQTVHTKQRNW